MKLTNDERAEIVARRLSYEADLGLFFWRPRPLSDFDHLPEAERLNAYMTFKGRYEWRPVVPTPVSHVGLAIRFVSEDMAVFAHRAAWLLTTGWWPRSHLHPIDGDRYNYRVENWVDRQGRTAHDFIRFAPKPAVQLEMEPLWIAAE